MTGARWIQGVVQMLRPSRWLARGLMRRADAARDRGRFAEAAPLYEEVLRLLPRHGAIRVQAGHMRKEIGDLDAALAHYQAAEALMPGDADLALQLGHYFKTAGRPADAIAAYRRALRLGVDAAVATREIEDLEAALRPATWGATEEAQRAWSSAAEAGFVPELLPEVAVPPERPRERIVLARAGGREEAGAWGLLPTIHGVGAVRGYLLSRDSFDTVTVTLDGAPLRSQPPIRTALADGSVEHVFNIWFDATACAPGPATLDVAFATGEAAGPSIGASVAIADGSGPEDGEERDDILPGGVHPPDLEAWIASLPSEVRPALARRAHAPRSILVLRVDQLGDMVVSVPALTRLRTLAGTARLVGLLTPANAEFARSLGLFDEVLVTPFSQSPVSRERVMSAADQAALRALLHGYRFDAAIDLGISHASRPLLLLSGAAELYGTKTGLWAWLDERLDAPDVPPPVEARAVPHSERLMRIVEHYGAAIGAIAPRPIVRRGVDDRARLAGFDLAPGRYLVLHEAIGHAHNRWPGFLDLVQRLLAETSLAIAFLTDAPDRRAQLATLAGRERVRLFAERLPFDDLDALLANAAAFAGIDSGPKHLSALRGVPVVSIHSARSDWREWGQEQTGVIVSRRLPCAGCGIGHHDNACGKDFACIRDIRPAEICASLLALLAHGEAERMTVGALTR